MAFFASLAYLILFFVHGYEFYESVHEQKEHYEAQAEMNNTNENNFNLNERRPDMEVDTNIVKPELEEAQQSPELTAENPSKNHSLFSK